MTKYFGIPFANGGDRTTIPDASQPGGEVSFTEGWTPDYEKDQEVDPTAKDISRTRENYFKFTVTEALKEIQEYGGKVYDPIVNYPVGAVTLGSDNILYRSLVKNGPSTGFTPVADPVGDTTGTWINNNLHYSNIAELRASKLTPVEGQVVKVLGYYAPGDGGGGPDRVWTLGTYAPVDDNGGNIIVLTGVTTGAFTYPIIGKVYTRDFGMSPTKTKAENIAIFDILYAEISIGDEINFGSGEYELTGNMSLTKGCVINSNGALLSFVDDISDTGVLALSDDIEIKDIKLKGPQFATRNDTQAGIKTRDADEPTYKSNLKVSNVTIYEFTVGINASYIDGFLIQSCNIFDMNRAGVTTLSGKNGEILANHVSNIVGDHNADYGIASGRNTDNSDLNIYPRPENIRIAGNHIKDVINWEGIDTHAGDGIIVEGNFVTDCKYGIVIAPDGSDYAPQNCKVFGNKIRRVDLAADAVVYGIDLSGRIEEIANNNEVFSNLVDGYGKSDSAVARSMRISYTENAKIHDNQVINSYGAGIDSNVQNTDIDIYNNTVDGVSDDDGGRNYGVIASSSPQNSGRISSNKIKNVTDGVRLSDDEISPTGANAFRLIDNDIDDASVTNRYANGDYAIELQDNNWSENIVFGSGLAEPSVAKKGDFYFETNASHPVGGITGFSDAHDGQVIRVLNLNVGNIWDFTSSNLKGRTSNIIANAGDTFVFIKDGPTLFRLLSYNDATL